MNKGNIHNCAPTGVVRVPETARHVPFNCVPSTLHLSRPGPARERMRSGENQRRGGQ